MSTKAKDEPSTAPKPDNWYPLTLGSSFKDQQNSSSRFWTLRYEFKPASIDKNQRGTLHKNKEERVAVEFRNNQPGKPNVSFEGSSEDYKDKDAVLFFDGQAFRLERLHRSVKRLRHVRQPGESAAAASMSGLGAAAAVDTSSPPVGKAASGQNSTKSAFISPVQVEVERIDVGSSSHLGGSRPDPEKSVNAPPPPSQPTQSVPSPGVKNLDLDLELDLDDELDIVDDEDDNNNNVGGFSVSGNENTHPQNELLDNGAAIDLKMPSQVEDDDIIADVDLNDDDMETGRNAAEALRAQVNAEGRGGEEEQSSSDSESSGSENSGSSSGSGSQSSSSNDSDSSGGDTVDSI